MPPDTPIPWRAKLTMRAPSRAADARLCPTLESVVQEGHDCRHRRLLVRPFGLHAYRRTDGRGEQHDGDDAARARAPHAAHQRHLAAKARGDRDDSGTSPCVEPMPVGDFDFAYLHDS